MSLTTYLNSIELFRNPAGSMPATPAFHFPFDPAPRTAILLDGFRETKTTRVFAGGWSHAAASFNPEAIAGPFSRLRDLAYRILDREIAIPSLDRAVIVFERLSGDWSLGRTLTASDRNLLWRAFRVPIYVQYIGLGTNSLPRNARLSTEPTFSPTPPNFPLPPTDASP